MTSGQKVVILGPRRRTAAGGGGSPPHVCPWSPQGCAYPRGGGGGGGLEGVCDLADPPPKAKFGYIFFPVLLRSAAFSASAVCPVLARATARLRDSRPPE